MDVIAEWGRQYGAVYGYKRYIFMYFEVCVLKSCYLVTLFKCKEKHIMYVLVSFRECMGMGCDS